MAATYGSGGTKVPSGDALAPTGWRRTGADLGQHLTEPKGLIELLVDQHLVPAPVIRMRQPANRPLVPSGVALQFYDSGLDGQRKRELTCRAPARGLVS